MVIAGGGTGGHIYPGLAIADEWISRHKDWEVVFAGTRNGMEKDIVPKEGYKLKMFCGMGVMGNSMITKIKGCILAAIGLFQSLCFFVRRRPDFVCGVGGYASGAPMLAAAMLRIPTLIHEENVMLGMTNRLLKAVVGKVTLSFRETLEEVGEKGVLTGNPVRVSSPDQIEKDPQKLNVLIIGGSRGAESINKLMINVMPLLEWRKDCLMIVHQTGKGKLGSLVENYRRYGIKADVREYIYDMGKAYAWADVVISRAGATTISELTSLGKASILIPFPYSAQGHQERNAEALANAGAAVMFQEKTLVKKMFADTLLRLAENRELVKSMGRKAADKAVPDASGKIVAVIEDMIGLKNVQINT